MVNGALPEGWKWTTISEIAENINPGFPSGRHNQESIGVPHLRPMNVSRNGEIDLSLVKYVEVPNYPNLLKGDVLFNNTNSPELVGKTAYIPKDTNWAYSNHMTRIRLRKDIAHPAWVASSLHYLFLNGFFKLNCRHHVNQASIGSGFLGEKVTIPLPPLPEQERIVAKIEELFTQLDAGVAALKRVKVALKRYKASLLKAACEGRLVPQDPNDEPAEELLRRLGKTPLEGDGLPELPEGWIWTTTGKLCDCIVPNRDKPKSFTGDIPWITLPDFSESIEISKSKAGLGLSEEETRKYRARIIPTGSVLMICVGRFGITAVATKDMVVNQQLHAFLVPKNVLDAHYLAYAIRTQIFYMEKVAAATTIAYMNKDNCNNVPIPLPPLLEQLRIVAKLDERLSAVQEVDEMVEKILRRAARLRQAVLKNAFEGKL